MAPGLFATLHTVKSCKGADGARIVVLRGDLDVFRADEVRQALQEAAAEPLLVIDLSEARSISASTLGELVRSYKQRLNAGLQTARVVVRSAHVRKIFDITGLSRLWPFFESVDAAKCHSGGMK